MSNSRSGAEIVVYGVNKEKFSNDAFLVYPESSLGTDHYTCSWSPSTLPTEFAVVATQDNTRVFTYLFWLLLESNKHHFHPTIAIFIFQCNNRNIKIPSELCHQ